MNHLQWAERAMRTPVQPDCALQLIELAIQFSQKRMSALEGGERHRPTD